MHRSIILSCYILWLAVGPAGAFLMPASAAFSLTAVTWLAFAAWRFRGMTSSPVNPLAVF